MQSSTGHATPARRTFRGSADTLASLIADTSKVHPKSAEKHVSAREFTEHLPKTPAECAAQFEALKWQDNGRVLRAARSLG